MSSLDFFCIPRVGSLTGAFKIKSIVSLRLPVNSFHECEPLKQQTIFIMPDQPSNSSSSSEDRFISDFSSLPKIISSVGLFSPPAVPVFFPQWYPWISWGTPWLSWSVQYHTMRTVGILILHRQIPPGKKGIISSNSIFLES